jgi:probable F420-dependent oxidoreductase
MKFGAGLPTGMEGLINPIPFFRPQDFIRFGRLAEELGYDSVWGNDHYAPQRYVTQKYAEPPNFYEVLTVLTAIAAVTERIELGTAVLVLPMRDIVTVAKQISTLDRLSGGRLLLGVGIGAYKEEYEAARPDLVGMNRGSVLEEGIDLLKRLMSEDVVDFSGRFFQVRNLRMYPKPARQPFRILVGGHQRKGIDRAVAHGQGWIPGWRPFEELKEWIAVLREKTEAAGRDPAVMIAAPQFSCLLGSSQEQAEQKYMASGMVQHRISLAYTGRDPSAAMENNLVGSPEAVLEKLEFLHEAGVDHLSCITFSVESVQQYEEQLRMFAEEVITPYRKAHANPHEGSMERTDR